MDIPLPQHMARVESGSDGRRNFYWKISRANVHGPADRIDSIDKRYDKKSPFSPSILTKQEIDFNVAMCIIEVP